SYVPREPNLPIIAKNALSYCPGRCHCDCAGPNATRIVSSRSNRIARGNFMRPIVAAFVKQWEFRYGAAAGGAVPSALFTCATEGPAGGQPSGGSIHQC